MTQTQTTHTRGPVEIETVKTQIGHAHKISGCNACLYVDNRDKNSIDQKTVTALQNARLLTAAYNSYDKHFGPRAVEAAEADLLGEALELLRAIDEFWSEAATSQKSGACISPSALLTDSDQPIASEVAALLSKLTP